MIKITIENKQYSVTSIIGIKDYVFVCLIENGKKFVGNVWKLNNDGDCVGKVKGEGSFIFKSKDNELVVYDSGYQFYINPDTLEIIRYEWVK